MHRDLKPENLFIALDEDGEPIAKVCDFGIAKLVGDSAAGMLATGALETAPSSLGTPMYMSPEQLRDSSAVDACTDQWALALIVFRALKGREYFGDAKSSGQLMARILVEPIVKPSGKGLDLGDAFDAWFLKSCSREPSERWSDVGAQVKACIAALEAEPTAIVIPKDTTAVENAATGVAPLITGAPAATTNKIETEGPSRRRRFLIAFAAALVVVFGVFEGMKMRNTPTVASATPAVPTPTPTPIAAPTPSPIATPTPMVAPKVVVPVAVHSAKPVVSASASVAPAKPTKLPSGAPCSRGGECASGYCFAEQCQ